MQALIVISISYVYLLTKIIADILHQFKLNQTNTYYVPKALYAC